MTLGRELKKGEVVHHKDGNKKNNDPDNLMVFASTNDHTMYHKGCKAFLDGDSWRCEKKSYKKVCECCGKEYFVENQKEYKERKFCSPKCSSNARIKTIYRIEDMINMLIETNGNFSEVSRRIGITPAAIAKSLKRAGYPYHSCDYNN